MLKHFASFSAGFFLVLAPSMAQSPADMQSRFSTLANSTRLTDSALKPWHLKISFNQMSSKVRPADSGVIEEWWVSAEQYRISLISTLYAGTTTRDGQQIARTEGVERLPAVYLDLLELFTNPLPSAERIEKSSVTRKHIQYATAHTHS